MVSLITQLSTVWRLRRFSMEVRELRELREVRLRMEERRPLAFQHPHLARPTVQPACRVRLQGLVPRIPPCRRRRVVVEEDASRPEISPNHLQLEPEYWPLTRQGSALLHPRENSIRE
jgi:hypothetical protein